MSGFQPTMRRDEFMVTFETRKRVTLNSALIAAALCLVAHDRETYETRPPLDMPSRREAEKHIRTVVAWRDLDDLFEFLGQDSEEEPEATRLRAVYAVATVRRLWPELDDRLLALFERDWANGEDSK